MPFVAAAATAGIMLAVTAGLVAVQSDSHRDEVAASVVREGSRMRADLERAIDIRIARTEALVGFATAEAADGSVDADRFERFAMQLQSGSRVPLRSLQLAPDAVVTYVHPLAGNEAAVGHDLLADPGRRAAVLATVEARRTMVAGPFELLQGGEAIVARAPVFVPTADGGEEWWGLATIVADAAPIFAEAALDANEDVEIAIRGRDGLGAGGEVFHGDETLFERDPELFDVTLPAGSWQLGILPAGGWDAVVWPERSSMVVGMTTLAILLAALVFRLLRNRERLQRVLEDRAELVATANVPILQVGADGRVLLWNGEAEAEAGLRADDVVGRAIHDDSLRRNDFARAVGEVVEETLRTGARVEGHAATVRREDGTTTELLYNAGPITDQSGTVTDVVVVAQDITARAEADRIRREHETLTATARLKDEFLATMSHELRTPLNGILGLTTLLRDETVGELNETQHEYLEHAYDAGTHLLQLINDVLDMSSLDADEDRLDLQPLAVAPIVKRATQLVAPELEVRGLALEVEVEVGDDVHVVADERRLLQVVLNLLANAAKFTDEGTVSIRAAVDGDEVTISVTDTGIGIAPEDRSRLFRPFVQLEGTLDRRYEGSGLGLALSSKLVDAFGGSIELESRVGRGSTFTVVLPAAGGPADGAAIGPTSERSGPLHRATVLVAEDNEVNRLIVTEYLRTLGHDFVTASNGAEAVELAREHRPEVVLMDIQMPTMDGLEATTILRADPTTADIPIVALTALAMDGDEERCRAAGCDAYLAKPIVLEDLATLLRDELGVGAT